VNVLTSAYVYVRTTPSSRHDRSSPPLPAGRVGRRVRRPMPPWRRRSVPPGYENRLVVPDNLGTTIKLSFLEGPARLAPADSSQPGTCCHLYRAGRRDVP
jgi:hypothetical protein